MDALLQVPSSILATITGILAFLNRSGPRGVVEAGLFGRIPSALTVRFPFLGVKINRPPWFPRAGGEKAGTVVAARVENRRP